MKVRSLIRGWLLVRSNQKQMKKPTTAVPNIHPSLLMMLMIDQILVFCVPVAPAALDLRHGSVMQVQYLPSCPITGTCIGVTLFIIGHSRRVFNQCRGIYAAEHELVEREHKSSSLPGTLERAHRITRQR